MIIRFLLSNMNIWTPLLAFILGFLIPINRSKYIPCANILRWYLLLVVGFMGCWNFVMHVFFGDMTAQLIGWPNSPFQYEVGIANLTFGVLGVIAFFTINRGFWCATVIGFFLWFFGDGVGHVYQLLIHKVTAPYNAGSTLYTDLLLPMIALWLLICTYRRIAV